MRKQPKRILSLLLSLVLCLTLLPMAALAEEDGEFTITFDAAPGAFEDGSATKAVRTTSGEDESTKHLVSLPVEQPVREGYTFAGWYVDSPNENPSVANRNFTANATVHADWVEERSNRMLVPFDANGGKFSDGSTKKELALKADGMGFEEPLPVPTRDGYTFLGWYRGYRSPSDPGWKIDQDQPFTAPDPVIALWKVARTSKITPSVSASPDKLETGEEHVAITLSCGGAALDWRPLERVIYSGNKPADLASAVKNYISGNFDSVGLKLIDVKFGDSIDVNNSAYPYELYPDGVYPASSMVLTFEGETKSGTLTLDLAPGVFVQPVGKNENTVLEETSAEIFNSVRLTIPVGSANPNGPFTVKFDLDYKNAKESEIPKEQKVPKGSTVSLPDGSKLTPPYSNYEFAAWCLKDSDGKLYPWNEQQTVTADMTLFAKWVEKGTAKQDPAEKPAQPSAPAKTAFTDVAAASPFAPAISWAVEKKITNGTTPTTFSPGNPCTRAQIVTFLWRAAGSPEPKAAEAEYADVTNADAYFYKAVQWAAEMGMEESGTFKPGDPCTRGQAMYFIWKARAGASSAGSAPHFTDLSTDSLYYDAVLWAVGQGVTNGTGDGTTFSPDNPCTRGQIVTFLYRAYASK